MTTDPTMPRETGSPLPSLPRRGGEAGARPVEVLSRETPRHIALAHDWLCGVRGGEKVLERIAAVVHARSRGRTPLYVLFDDGKPMSPAVDECRRVASPMMSLPGALRLRRWLLPAYPPAVRALSKRLAGDHARTPFDLLISTSSAAIKGLQTPSSVKHLCYCHSPARYVWSRREDYAEAGGLARAGLAWYGERFRAWDRATAANVTHFLANSTHTASQIRTCYGRDAEVVFPPANTDYFTPNARVPREDFWLLVGAIEPYKRTSLAIDAAARAGKRLIVVGSGSLERSLRERVALSPLPHAQIQFVGRVSDERLRDLYRRARLLLFPQVEDFGIVAAEALACGLPVVARRAGGAVDIVDDGPCGALFDGDAPDALIHAAARVESRPTESYREACRRSAERFSIARFDREINACIDRVLAKPSAPR